MKRDLELVKKILLKAESLKANNTETKQFLIDGYDENVINEHIQLLHEAGFIDGAIGKTNQGIVHAIIYRLTWEGHEFLDSLKNDNAWKKAKSLMKEKGQSLPFSILREIMIGVIKANFSLP